jgi:hypothetical protein
VKGGLGSSVDIVDYRGGQRGWAGCPEDGKRKRGEEMVDWNNWAEENTYRQRDPRMPWKRRKMSWLYAYDAQKLQGGGRTGRIAWQRVWDEGAQFERLSVYSLLFVSTVHHSFDLSFLPFFPFALLTSITSSPVPSPEISYNFSSAGVNLYICSISLTFTFM